MTSTSLIAAAICIVLVGSTTTGRQARQMPQSERAAVPVLVEQCIMPDGCDSAIRRLHGQVTSKRDALVHRTERVAERAALDAWTADRSWATAEAYAAAYATLIDARLTDRTITKSDWVHDRRSLDALDNQQLLDPAG